MSKDLDNFDMFMGNEGKQQPTVIQDYDKTTKQKMMENWQFVKSRFEWGKLPSTLLVTGIMLIGAVLMYASIMSFTNNFIVAILSPCLSEIGILSWSASLSQPSNTKKQVEIARFMRQLHIIFSVVLLTLNIILEASTVVFAIKIDGAIWAVFGIMGFVSFMDIWNYYKYKDNDRENSIKLEFASREAELKAETHRMMAEAKHEAEIIRTQAEVDFLRKHAPQLARKLGEVNAAGNLNSAYKKIGLSRDEVASLFSDVESESKTDYRNAGLIESINVKPVISEEPLKKRQYIRKVNPEKEQKAAKKIEEKMEQKNVKQINLNEEKENNPSTVFMDGAATIPEEW